MQINRGSELLPVNAYPRRDEFDVLLRVRLGSTVIHGAALQNS
jgi:hypothetical protein